MTGVLIDTSGEEITVVLVKDTEVLAQERGKNNKVTTKLVLEILKNALNKLNIEGAELDRIGVVATARNRTMGVRTGVTIANALALGWRIPVVELEAGEIDSLIIQLNQEKVKEVAQVRYYLDKNS